MQHADALADEPFVDLVMSILAVNNYSLEKVFGVRESLLQEGLFDPEKFTSFKPTDIYAKLVAAGYDRGEFLTWLFTERLCSLGELISRQGVETFRQGLSGTDLKGIGSFLKPVKGVGPVVLRNYACLRDFRSNSK